MEQNIWPFTDEPNVMVMTTKGIIQKNNPILYVSHDEEDGMWQFHDGSELDEEDAMLVGLKEVVCIDSSIRELSELPLGWIAWRESNNDTWKKQREE